MSHKITIDEVLSNPKILEFVRKVKELYPAKVFLVAGTVRRGWTEHDLDITIEVVEGQDGSELKEFLATLSDWKDKTSEFGCRVRLPEFPLKIDIGDMDHSKTKGAEVEIKI